MDTRQQPIQGDEAGFTGEERIKAARQLPAEPFAWLSAIGFQSGVERPESGLDAFLFPPLVIWTLLTKVETSCDRILIAGGANVEAEWEQGPAV